MHFIVLLVVVIYKYNNSLEKEIVNLKISK